MVEGRKALSYLPDAGFSWRSKYLVPLQAERLGILVVRLNCVIGDPPGDLCLVS